MSASANTAGFPFVRELHPGPVAKAPYCLHCNQSSKALRSIVSHQTVNRTLRLEVVLGRAFRPSQPDALDFG